MTSHFVFVVFLAFSYLHTPSHFLPYLVSAAVIYGGDKLVRCVWGLLPKRTTEIDVSSADVVRLKFRKNQAAVMLNRYQPGQYVFLNVPSVSLLQWHPFSLTSSPSSLYAEDELCIRVLGDFTKRLHAHASRASSHKRPLYVRVDGPYGNVNLDFKAHPNGIFFAGGIGITPIISIVRSVYNLPDSSPPADVSESLALAERACGLGAHASLAKQPAAPAAARARKASAADGTFRQCLVVWNIARLADFRLFAHVFSAARQASLAEPQLPRFDIRVFVSKRAWPDVAEKPPSFFRPGRCDPASVINDVYAFNPSPVYVFACGPDALTTSVWDSATRCSLDSSEGTPVTVHRETFQL